MLLKYFYDEQLAQASYLLACSASGTAIIIDPARNIQPYLDAAKRHNLMIEFVTETHIHADLVSGIRELAHATGAKMLLSAEGDTDWQYQFPDENVQLLKDGDTIMIGGVKLDVLHTPGHTPEHLIFAVTDSHADKVMGIFTGDCLFVGDVGRPDLLEESAGQQGTREIGARQQFANIQRFKQMPDYLQVFPGHGAGSACGKALGAVPSTTLGYEKLFNPAFQYENEADFVEWLLAGQPEAPRYFAQMKKVNKQGAKLLAELLEPERITDKKQLDPYNNLVIDTRHAQEFAQAHIAGTVNIPYSAKGFATYVGWYIDFDEPCYLIAAEDNLQPILTELRAIGVDNIAAYLPLNFLNEASSTIIQKTPEEIHELGIKILDVRSMSEYQDSHIPNVQHIHMGYVSQHLQDIPTDEPLVIQCGGGLRSQIVASILQREGFTNIINMAGGISQWKKDQLPIE